VSVNRGIPFALLSASLFGLSAPAAKVLLSEIDPWMLAGLLYLGSGVGLGVVFLARRALGRAAGTGLRRADLPWLAGAIGSGGVAGPLLLMFGLASGPAAQSSLLLNLESVFTVLLAWWLFGEHVGLRIAVGAGAITAAAVLLSRGGPVVIDGSAVLVSAACLAWAIDNNLTRRLSGSDAVQIAAIKGLGAGAVNVLMALARAGETPGPGVVAAGAVVGFLGYGVSLVLFVLALRHLGAARTGAYFATAPFVGAVASVLVLQEPASPSLIAAGVLMGAGVWLHLTERHEHAHAHDAVEHDHAHEHDDHHRHEHPAGVPLREPHAHPHTHTGLRHAHPHYPDLHHRHGH
jgi:drug/metabolite transporter (DMT)-like permease